MNPWLIALLVVGLIWVATPHEQASGYNCGAVSVSDYLNRYDIVLQQVASNPELSYSDFETYCVWPFIGNNAMMTHQVGAVRFIIGSDIIHGREPDPRVDRFTVYSGGRDWDYFGQIVAGLQSGTLDYRYAFADLTALERRMRAEHGL